MAFEVNFDGLIGPTHNYSGLSLGNVASANHAKQMSYPKAAALQGLGKMRRLMSMGYKQGVLPPQVRPDINCLRNLGFTGSDEKVINQTAKQSPELLAMVYSASSMWAANAATVSPSADTADGKVHFTVANLLTTAHRAIESEQTARLLRSIFSDQDYFSVHDALKGGPAFGDEGAANHNRLCEAYGSKGAGLFVYGQGKMQGIKAEPKKFPARQSLSASQVVARQHGVDAVFLQQNVDIIDAGAFHNDVVAVANGPVLFHHSEAFRNEDLKFALDALNKKLPVQTVMVPADVVSVEDAISSYLFNSQLLASPDGCFDEMHLIAPNECKETPSVHAYLEQLVQDHSQAIRQVTYVDVRQSMSNGGGPACLRLRVVLTENEIEAVSKGFILDEEKISLLENWVERHYRESLLPKDLADPQLLKECHGALAALSEMFGDLYQF
ncbi:MAG: succinylarginine dihydrolase [Candidatus Azotimanducaceae bacterium]|jgi:succinylarginine dihydrolase